MQQKPLDKLQVEQEATSSEWELQNRTAVNSPHSRKPATPREGALALLQSAILQLHNAKQTVQAKRSNRFPAGNITVILGTSGRVDVFTDGTVVYSPKASTDVLGEDLDISESPADPHIHYIVGGPAGEPCNCCHGSGKQ